MQFTWALTAYSWLQGFLISIYEVPLLMQQEHLDNVVLEKLSLVAEKEQISYEDQVLMVRDVGLITLGESIEKAIATADFINRLCEIEIGNHE